MSTSSVPCPHCGALLSEEAGFCRICGSSDADGWSDESGLSDAEEDFDYDEFIQREFSGSVTQTAIPLYWRITAGVLLVLFLLGFLTAFF